MVKTFIDEHIIYEFMRMRFNDKQLKVRKVISQGKPVYNPSWINVHGFVPPESTRFPDIDEISFGPHKKMVPAEVKFITSKFDYHNPSDSNYDNYLEQKKLGLCVIVLKHDHMPSRMSAEQLDVWELDYHDFSAYCRDNFTQLLERQLDISIGNRYLLMAPGRRNFYRNSSRQQIPPAIESGIWCPQSRLTGYDIAPGDRILFISFRGANSVTLQPIWRAELLRLDKGGSKRNWVKRAPSLKNWVINRLTICEVSSTIQSREEYCNRNKIGRNDQLWVVDPISSTSGNRDTWDRVFEFRKLFDFQVDARLVDIYDRGHGHILVDQLSNFLSQGGRNRFVLDINQYEYLLQKILELAGSAR